MICSKCRRRAVISQRYSGLHLCRMHFGLDFEAKAKRAIRVHRWIAPGDRIGIVLDGNKGGIALLRFLERLAGKRRDVELVALCIDEGAAGCHDRGIALPAAGHVDIPVITASFKAELGVTVDQVLSRKGPDNICSCCRILREVCLDRVAGAQCLTRLAVPTDLDSLSRDVFVRVLSGDEERIAGRECPAGTTVPRILPFMYIPEREVILYEYYNGGHIRLPHCPRSKAGPGPDLRAILDEYAWRHPSTFYSLVNLAERLGMGISGWQELPRGCSALADFPEGSCRLCAPGGGAGHA